MDFRAIIQSGVDPGLIPGARVDGQFWSRDRVSPGGSSLTDAIELVLSPC